MAKKIIPAFYNPVLDVITVENKFLLKRRIRLMNKLAALKGKTDMISGHNIRVATRKLDQVEKKLGIA